MRGDKLLIERHHLAAADRIANLLLARIAADASPYAISIAGESGSGKSEVAEALAESLARLSLKTLILQQDDYFIFPPMTNDARRRETIDRVGPQEVQLDWIDRNIEAIVHGAEVIHKPLVFYAENRIEIQDIPVQGYRVVIAEGTYTTLLEHVDLRIFIDRTYVQTLEARRKRAREAPDPFIERVLALEHNIIKEQKTKADIVIDDDYAVQETIRKA